MRSPGERPGAFHQQFPGPVRAPQHFERPFRDHSRLFAADHPKPRDLKTLAVRKILHSHS